jgi:hypothetical protein
MVKSKRRPLARLPVSGPPAPAAPVNPADLISRLWYPLGFDRPDRFRRNRP